MFCVVAGCESCCSPYVPHLRLAKLTRNKERAQDRESIKKYKDKLRRREKRQAKRMAEYKAKRDVRVQQARVCKDPDEEADSDPDPDSE